MSDSELISNYDSDSDAMDGLQRSQLLEQITELQSAVTDMKSAFTAAVQQLGHIQQEDQGLWEKVECNKIECQAQVADVLKLMLSMKAEFATVKHQIQLSNEAQQNLQRQLQNFVWERSLLVEELYKSGSISDQIRYHLQNARHIERGSSGSHSNDSGVMMFLEKVQSPFQSVPFPRTNDQESVSLPEQSPLTVSPLVNDYVAGLDEIQVHGAHYEENGNFVLAYDSDSSLVNAANKSLTLSTSLGKQCGLELDQWEAMSDDDVPDDDIRSPLSRGNVSSSSEPSIKSSPCDPEDGLTIVRQLNINRDIYRENQRLKVIKEILETERQYCMTLVTLKEIFAEPLKDSGILGIKDINTLFPEEVYQFYGKHCILMHNLEERVQGWNMHITTVGDIFSNFTDPAESDVLQLYTSYIDDFPEVLTTFHKLCRQSTKFRKFLKTCLVQPTCCGLDLGVFLVTPVQRVPHYILLLKRLIRVSGKNHPDTPLLDACLQRLKDFLNRLNDTMEHSFQLIASQIQAESEPGLHLKRNSKATGGKKLTRHHVSNDGSRAEKALNLRPLLKSTSKESINSSCGTEISSKNNAVRNYRHPWKPPCQGERSFPTHPGSSCTPTSSFGSSYRSKMRSRSRSESVVSSLSGNSDTNGEKEWDGGCLQPFRKRSSTGGKLFCDDNPHSRDTTLLYYWEEESQLQSESEQTSLGMQVSDTNKGDSDTGSSFQGAPEDLGSDLGDEQLPKHRSRQPRFGASKSMQDVKGMEPCTDVRSGDGENSKRVTKENVTSSVPNLVESELKLESSNSPHAKMAYSDVERVSSLACINSPGEVAYKEHLEGECIHSKGGRRLLSKAQSSHAVHHLAKEQNRVLAPSRNSISNISSCSSSGNAAMQHKASNIASFPSKDKKKISLRTSLKNLLFKKRNVQRGAVCSSFEASARCTELNAELGISTRPGTCSCCIEPTTEDRAHSGSAEDTRMTSKDSPDSPVSGICGCNNN